MNKMIEMREILIFNFFVLKWKNVEENVFANIRRSLSYNRVDVFSFKKNGKSMEKCKNHKICIVILYSLYISIIISRGILG